MLADHLIFRRSVTISCLDHSVLHIFLTLDMKRLLTSLIKHIDLKLCWVGLSILKLTCISITQASVTMLQMCLLRCVWALAWYGLHLLIAQLHPISTWQVRNFFVFLDFVGSSVYSKNFYNFVRILNDAVTSVSVISNIKLSDFPNKV